MEKEAIQSNIQFEVKRTNIALHFLDDRLYKVQKDSGEVRIINNIKEQQISFMMEENFPSI